MAGKIVTNTVQLGDSNTPSQNFVLQTNNTGSVRLARGSDGSTSQDILTVDGNGVITTIKQLTSGTAVATTSGTFIDFTGIPSWVKRITVMFNGVSTNGTGHWLVQVGNGSFVNSGYASGAAGHVNGQIAGVVSSNAGFIVLNDSATDTRSGVLTISLMTGTTYVSSHSLMTVNGAGTSLRTVAWSGSGISGSAGAAIDRIRLTTVNGTDTFDGGSVNIMYEG